MNSVVGGATVEGTRRFRDRNLPRCTALHFRETAGLVLGTIGIGTARGESSDAVDRAIVSAIERSVAFGINVIDTAINYRDGRSERCVGAAVRVAVARRDVARDELFIASKAGYLPLSPGLDRHYAEHYLASIGCLSVLDEVVDGCHCFAPGFLAHQLERSRASLQLDTLDVYYLHNPEVQLREIDRARFCERMSRAFVFLEAMCAAGVIRRYGLATWHGLRVALGHPLHLDLGELKELARDAAVGGADHLAFVQVPFNPLLPEILVATQRLRGREIPLLAAAEELGLGVIASAAAAGGQPVGPVLATLGEPFCRATDSEAQRSLQFARSVPQIACCLVGTKTPGHLAEILALAERPPLRFEGLLGSLGD